MLTTSDTLNGGGARFAGGDPLAQLSRVFYDRLNRFQLSKVCHKLGLNHKAGEKHEVLVRLLDMAVEMRRTPMERVQAVCREVLIAEHEMIEKARGEASPDENPFEAVYAAPAATAPPVPTTDDVLEFACLTMADKRMKLKELGVKFVPADDGKALLAKWREATGN